MATKAMMIPLYGKRHGNWIVPCATQCWLKETAVTPGHIVKMQGRYLECVGFQDDSLMQPRFVDVTREIYDVVHNPTANSTQKPLFPDAETDGAEEA